MPLFTYFCISKVCCLPFLDSILTATAKSISCLCNRLDCTYFCVSKVCCLAFCDSILRAIARSASSCFSLYRSSCNTEMGAHTHVKKLFMIQVNSEGSGEPANRHILTKAFTAHIHKQYTELDEDSKTHISSPIGWLGMHVLRCINHTMG